MVTNLHPKGLTFLKLWLQYFIAHMHHLDVFRVTRSKLSSYASGKCNIIRPNKDISLEQPGNQLASLSIYQSQLVTVGLLASKKGKPSLSKHSSLWNHPNDGNASICDTYNLDHYFVIIRKVLSLTISIFIALLGCIS